MGFDFVIGVFIFTGVLAWCAKLVHDKYVAPINAAFITDQFSWVDLRVGYPLTPEQIKNFKSK